MQTPFATRIRKIGSSFGVIIPIEILRAHKWERGDYVAFANIDDVTLAVRKIPDALLKEINVPTIKT